MKNYIFKIKYYLSRILLYIFVLPKKKRGAEIGVWEGTNAKLLWRFARPRKLFLVDPYLEGHRTKEERDKTYAKVVNWVWLKNIIILKTTSEKASKILADKPLFDWVYIDGDHSDLYEDLTYWYDKVKLGGIIMGDDYTDSWPEVKRDIKTFCKIKGIKLHTFHCQWWIRR